MKIILELTLLVEIFLNFLIIKITSLVLRERAQNCIFSSIIGGELTLLYPMFFNGLASKIILIILSANLLVFVSFKFKSFKDFLRIYGVFILTTFVFGGGMLAIQNIIGKYPVYLILCFGLVLYICIYCVMRAVQKKNRIKSFCYHVKVRDNGKEFEEDGFLDSGNMLYDNITKKPVVLINFDVFHKLYSNISFSSIITKTLDKSSIKNGHYIKINSIGSKTNILVFTVDELIVGDDKNYKDAMVGLSLSGFERSFGRNMLLHSELI